MGQLGFSPVGAVALLAVLVPNLLWARYAVPDGYDASGESRVLRALERVGQVLVVASLLLFTDTTPGGGSPWSWWLVAAAAVVVLLLACWVRYFRSAHTMRDFYRPFLGVPVPLAVLPVTASGLLGVHGRLLPLVVGALVMGVGHLGIHLRHAAAVAERG